VKKTKRPLTAVLIILFFISTLPGTVSAQQYLDLGTQAPVNSTDEKLHALTLTRFHFKTLKALHAGLYSDRSNRAMLDTGDAEILDAGIAALLASDTREEIILEALRQNMAVRLNFSVPEEPVSSETRKRRRDRRLIDEPQDLAVSLEFRPLLDGPTAFEITLEKGRSRYCYDVNWAGRIDGMATAPLA